MYSHELNNHNYNHQASLNQGLYRKTLLKHTTWRLNTWRFPLVFTHDIRLRSLTLEPQTLVPFIGAVIVQPVGESHCHDTAGNGSKGDDDS